MTGKFSNFLSYFFIIIPSSVKIYLFLLFVIIPIIYVPLFLSELYQDIFFIKTLSIKSILIIEEAI